MIDIGKSLRHPSVSAFLSFLIGLGVIVMLFHKPFTQTNVLSMPLSKVEGTPIRNNGKCFSYKAEDAMCFNSKN